MDATCRPLHFSKEYFAYAESKKIFEIFRNMLEHLLIDRPDRPVDYLCDLLLKNAVYDVPKVFLLGPPTIDRALICTTLASKFNFIHLSKQNLLENLDQGRPNEVSALSLPEILKSRISKPDCYRYGWIVEALPESRKQAFALRQMGIFPTHIVVVESDVKTWNDMSADEFLEKQIYTRNKPIILDFYQNDYLRHFKIDGDLDNCVTKVVEFVRSKQRPAMPFLPRIFLFGPYGSGRKTMAKRLCDKYQLKKVDYQEELRRAALKDSPLKLKFQDILKTPEPVPDEFLAEVASQRLMQPDCIETGWVLFNFPGTENQAKLLTKLLEGFQVNRAIFLETTLRTCLDRVEPRRLDPATGNMYHLKLKPKEMYVPVSRLIQLPQDTEESVQADFELYRANAESLKKFFQQSLTDDIMVEIDANTTEEEVYEQVEAAILQSTKTRLSDL